MYAYVESIKLKREFEKILRGLSLTLKGSGALILLAMVGAFKWGYALGDFILMGEAYGATIKNQNNQAWGNGTLYGANTKLLRSDYYDRFDC